MTTDRLAGRRLLVGAAVVVAVGAVAWRMFRKERALAPKCGATPVPGDPCAGGPALAGAASPGVATPMWAGTLTRPEMTAYQYGTHLLTGRLLDGDPDRMAQSAAFALRSSRVRLDDWVGKSVIVTGRPVAGYPLDFGPPLIEVDAVEIDQVFTIDGPPARAPQ